MKHDKISAGEANSTEFEYWIGILLLLLVNVYRQVPVDNIVMFQYQLK